MVPFASALADLSFQVLEEAVGLSESALPFVVRRNGDREERDEGEGEARCEDEDLEGRLASQGETCSARQGGPQEACCSEDLRVAREQGAAQGFIGGERRGVCVLRLQ